MTNKISVTTVLSSYLKAMQAKHTLITNKIHSTAGKPATNSIVLLTDTSRLDGVYVQIGKEDRRMRISSEHFKKWLFDNGHTAHSFFKAMKDDFGMTQQTGRMGGGTPVSSPTEFLINIDLRDPRLAGFIDYE
jgi:hypothetical protein